MAPPAPAPAASSSLASRNEDSAPNRSSHDNTSACPSSNCSTTTCSVLSDSKIQQINGNLRQLNANELATLRPLIKRHIQQREVLKQIQSCDASRFDALVTKNTKINDFLHQIEAKDLGGLRFLIQKHEDLKKIMKKLVAEEQNLVDSCKSDEGFVIRDLLRQLTEKELGHIETLVKECVVGRQEAAFVPHPTRCFFLEMPRELRDRVYVFLGRRFIAAALKCLRRLSTRELFRDLGSHGDFAIWNTNHQIRAEFTDMIYSPEVLCGRIWDSKATPPRWTMMSRSLLELCFQEVVRRRRTCLVDTEWVNEWRWPPEMLEIPPGSNASSHVRIAKIYWFSIKVSGRRKHISVSCRRSSSSPAFSLWACEAPESMKDRLSKQWRVKCQQWGRPNSS